MLAGNGSRRHEILDTNTVIAFALHIGGGGVGVPSTFCVFICVQKYYICI